MSWFKTPLKYWGMTSALVFFFLFIFKFVQADDIEIDLGATPTIAKAVGNTSVIPKRTAIIPVVKNMPQSINSSSTKSLEVSLIDKIDVSSDLVGTLVSIDGSFSKDPLVDKISNKKILVKFFNSKIDVNSHLRFNNPLVKSVRSASHGKDAWVVLDVQNVKSWKVSKVSSGYVLLLSNQKTIDNVESPISPSTTENEHNVKVSNEEMSGSLFARLTEASIKPLDKGIKIVLTSDQPANYTFRKLSQPEKLVLRFHSTKLDVAEKIRRFNDKDVEFVKGGLVSMELRQIGQQFSPISEVILTLVPGTLNQIDRDMNQVVITLAAPIEPEKSVEKKADINQLVSMDIQNADLNAVLKTLCSEVGFDVDFVSGPLSGTVNEKFENIPLKTAISNLLAPGNYSYEVQGNRIRVATASVLKASKATLPKVTEIISPSGGMTPAQLDSLVRQILDPNNASISAFDTVRNVIILNGTVSDVEEYKRTMREMKLGMNSSGDRITKVVKLNYSDPAVLQTILSAYLTPVGKVQVDPRTSSLVIWESASNMGTLLELIKEMDVKSPQVLIESNIVEVDKENDLDLGFSWNLTKTTGDPTLSAVTGGALQNTDITPAALSFGTVKGGVNINGTLNALETRKLGKIISRPRVATASGVAAEIDSVENVIYVTNQQTVGLGGVVTNNTVFNTLALPVDLKITPRITNDGRITTVINATVTSQTGPPAGAGAPPPTSVQTATSTITIKNGQTIVMGGLVRDTLSDTYDGIPLLMNLPLIGDLFQNKTLQHKKVELVIFITPTIIQD